MEEVTLALALKGMSRLLYERFNDEGERIMRSGKSSAMIPAWVESHHRLLIITRAAFALRVQLNRRGPLLDTVAVAPHSEDAICAAGVECGDDLLRR